MGLQEFVACYGIVSQFWIAWIARVFYREVLASQSIKEVING